MTGISPTKRCATVSHVLVARVYEAISEVTTVFVPAVGFLRRMDARVDHCRSCLGH